MDNPAECLFCHKVIYKYEGDWVHEDGYADCRTTYATPFLDYKTNDWVRIK